MSKMTKREWDAALSRIRKKDDRFKTPVYFFVIDALGRAVSMLQEVKHLSAKELVDGFVTLVFERYGVLAGLVVVEWGISSTDDIGSIVSHLIDEGILLKRDEDSIEDFNNIFDLEEILNNPDNYSIM